MKKEYRAGIFYDGYHVIKRLNKDHNYNPQHFNYNKLNDKILKFLHSELDIECRLLFKGWYQGVDESYLGNTVISKCEDIKYLKKVVNQYHLDHVNHFRLIEAGIESIYLPNQKDNEGVYREKGVDVALSVAVGNMVQNLKMDMVIILTNDSDYVPLIHNIAKKGITTVVINFQENSSRKLKDISDYFISYDSVQKLRSSS